MTNIINIISQKAIMKKINNANNSQYSVLIYFNSLIFNSSYHCLAEFKWQRSSKFNSAFIVFELVLK